MIEENGYTLDNAETRAEKHADTFHIPPREEREELAVGDFAKLIFYDEYGGGERMWVRVNQHLTDGRYVGALASHPLFIDNLSWGKTMCFGPEHVIDIRSDQELRGATSAYH